MVHTVGSYEAKTHLPALLEKVSHGDTVLITKRGVPVAQIVPPDVRTEPEPKAVIEDLLAYSKAQARTLGGATIRQLIDEGRRF